VALGQEQHQRNAELVSYRQSADFHFDLLNSGPCVQRGWLEPGRSCCAPDHSWNERHILGLRRPAVVTGTPWHRIRGLYKPCLHAALTQRHPRRQPRRSAWQCSPPVLS
jgi:hypothetical protein